MAKSLDASNVDGRKIAGMQEPGQTYAFWFQHRSVRLYGKINLKPDGKIVLIYSSHLPRKGNTKL